MDRIALASAPVVFGVVASAVGLPLLGTVWAPAAVDTVLVGLAAVGGVTAVAGWLGARRHLAALPLTLADVVLVGRVDGRPAYRFRVWLGNGRCMRRPRAVVTFEAESGVSVLEPLVADAPALVGPWTLVVVDRAGVCDGPGRFRVVVRATEGHKQWEVERTWPREAARPGAFAPGVVVRGGRIAWQPERFGEVVTPADPA